jgi:hypothetical protein
MQGENLPDDIYCDLINNLKDLCLHSSLLDIWKYDRELIYTATQAGFNLPSTKFRHIFVNTFSKFREMSS